MLGQRLALGYNATLLTPKTDASVTSRKRQHRSMRHNMKLLITGMAGFIGHAVAKRLSTQSSYDIVGVDNLSDYYDVSLKKARLDDLAASGNIRFERLDLADREAVAALFETEGFDSVIHLAAQPGVRYSLENLMPTPMPTSWDISMYWKAVAMAESSICLCVFQFRIRRQRQDAFRNVG